MSPKQSASTVEQLQVGAQTLTYTLTFANRKSVGITVRPDMSVTVRAPQGMSRQAVAEVVQKRAPWILRHLQKFSQRPAKQPLASKQVGDTYPFLGRDIPIRIRGFEPSTGKTEKVILQNNVLHLWTKEVNNKERTTALLDKWSRKEADTLFLVRMIALFRHFEGLRLQFPLLIIRRMKARWGSCGTNGVITLNVKLIHLEPALIDYVIMHELCHLVEHNHSEQFYALLTQMMPDWSERRQRLNTSWMPD